jgi:hypothetical protein
VNLLADESQPKSAKPIDTSQAPNATFADINITAKGDRRTLEAIYLELREVAQQYGLKIKYRLTQTEPEDQGGG